MLEGALPEAVLTCYKFCFMLHGCVQLWGHRVFLPFSGQVYKASPAFYAASPLRLEEEKMQIKIKGFKPIWALMLA